MLDVQVWINFAPAPILAIAFESGYQQINVQVPWEGTRDPLYVEVFQGANRVRFEGPYTNSPFGLPDGAAVFFSDSNGHAVLQHASDYSPVTPDHPARAGQNVIAYGINLGPVNNLPPTGYPAPSNPPSTFNPGFFGSSICSGDDAVVVGTTKVIPDYDGLAPGLVGIYQVNFKVPDGVSGELPLAIARTYTLFPLGPCEPDLQKSTAISTRASALISVR